ncbi:MAG: ABC transporter ATP-binding protein [bacterium]
MEIIKTEDLIKNYYQGNVIYKVLRGVNLKVKKGEFVVIAGPSGSGKTTLLNLVGCLDIPTAGNIFICEKNISKLSMTHLSRLRKEKIGFIFQTFNLIPVFTAYENVEFPLLLQKTNKKERQRKILHLFDEIGLTEVKNSRPNELSGGQQQRVSIARALVIDPIIIIADEPTANLDSFTGHAIIELMRRFNTEKGVTFLFSTHDPMIMKHASRVEKIHDGVLVK